MQIDLNADVGESFGVYRYGDDEGVIPCVSSANIACGFHAGDPAVMRNTVQLATAHGVAVGAHPGFQDLPGFGRREMHVGAAELESLVAYQIGALAAIAAAEGDRLSHVKPHGALYNMAARDAAHGRRHRPRRARPWTRRSSCSGCRGRSSLPPASAPGCAWRPRCLPTAATAPDGSLAPRGTPGAVMTDAAEVVARARWRWPRGKP